MSIVVCDVLLVLTNATRNFPWQINKLVGSILKSQIICSETVMWHYLCTIVYTTVPIKNMHCHI